MTEEHHTWPDVFHYLIEFAREEPVEFIFTIPLGLVLALVALLIFYRIFFTGPAGRAFKEFKKHFDSLFGEEEK